MKYIFLTALLFFISCSDSVGDGGATVDVTNGIMVISSLGLPAAGSTAEVIDGALWHELIESGVSPVVDTITANEDGLLIPGSTIGSRSIFISYGTEVGIIHGNVDTVYLEEAITLKGSAEGEKIFFAGTPYSAEINNDSFIIAGIPTDLYSPYIKISDSILPSARIKISGDSTINPISENRLLFDDFKGGFANNPLRAVSSGVFWYLTSDSTKMGYINNEWVSKNEISTGNSDISAEELDEKIKTILFLGNKTNSAFAGIGATVRGTSATDGFNLSEMTSVSMRIRGTGITYFSLKTKQNIELNISSYGKTLDLDSTWQDIEIPVDSLSLSAEDSTYEISHPWSTVSKDVQHIQFMWNSNNNMSDSSYWMEVDTIFFNGITKPF